MSEKIEIATEEITLKTLAIKILHFFNYLKTKWITISLFIVLSAVLGLVYAIVKKPEYKAVFTFALEDDKQSVTGLSGALGIASSLGIDLGTNAGGAFSGSNLIELMKSHKMVEQTLLESIEVNHKNIVLANLFLKFSGVGKELEKESDKYKNFSFPINSERKNFSIDQDSVLMLLYERIFLDNVLTVSQRDKKISIITVEVNSKSELFSKYFAEHLVKNVSDFYVETKSRKARNNVSILQNQADSIRKELNNAIAGVAIISDKTFNLNPALNVNRIPSSKRQVDVQANTAILTQLVTNLELAKVSLLKETPLIQTIDKPTLPLKNNQLKKIKSIIIGGLLGGVLIIFFYFIQLLWQKIFE